MPATPDDLFAYLDRLGIDHPTVHHPPLFTVEESQTLRGVIPGGHTKNLFLKDKKGTLYLVTALEHAAIELKSLHRRLGASGRFSFGPADQMREVLGIEPGAVTPFAAMNDTAQRVTMVLDQALMAHPVINCHPLRNTMTTSMPATILLSSWRPPAIGHGSRRWQRLRPGLDAAALQTLHAGTIWLQILEIRGLRGEPQALGT